MSCKLCFEKLDYSLVSKIGRACASCRKQYTHMMAGFHGVVPEKKSERELWDNSESYQDWVTNLGEADPAERVPLKKEDYTQQRCDTRDMRRLVGLPEFKSLEGQVYTAWIEEGTKDERMQEVLGLTYDQLQHVKSIVRIKLRKQMAFYFEIKQLEAQAEALKKRKGL